MSEEHQGGKDRNPDPEVPVEQGTLHDWNEAYSSKIKKVFIELQDYGYFHNPSEIGNPDRRFMGREAIKTQLQSLLTQNETKSGSYLVTGYRGMGKSSFVNQVVSEISCGYGKKKTGARLVRILLAVVFLSLFRFDPSIGQAQTLWLFALPLAFCIVAPIWLIFRSPLHDMRAGFLLRTLAKCSLWLLILDLLVFTPVSQRVAPNLYPLVKGFFDGFFQVNLAVFLVFLARSFLPRTFRGGSISSNPTRSARLAEIFFGRKREDPDRREKKIPASRMPLRKRLWVFLAEFCRDLFRYESERVSERRTRAFVFDAFIIALIFLIGHWLLPSPDFRQRFGTDLLLFLVFLLGNLASIFPRLSPTHEMKPEAAGLRSKESLFSGFRVLFLPFYNLFIRLVGMLRKYTNYSHRFYIQVNLGHDELKEVDILRLIACNLTHCFRRVRGAIPFCFPTLVYKASRITCFFLVFWLVYHSSPIKNISNDLRRRVDLAELVPSQRYYSLDSPFPKARADFASELQKPTTIGNYAGLAYFPANQKEKPNAPTGWRLVPLYADWLITSLYRKARDEVSWWARSLNLAFLNTPANYLGQGDGKDQILPPVPDYLFWGYLSFFWGLIRFWTNRWGLFGWVTHGYMHRKILELNDRIYSQVHRASSGSVSSKWNLGFHLFKEKKQQFPIADVREIEKELIDILAEIDRIPRIMGRPQFIFIFDELDKIEPHENVSLHEKEEERGPTFGTDRGEKLLYQLEETRKRQHTILSILANLKYLLTTAKAKFIFIAGREMYDASLADVSDRHYFIGSIFNAVIYVPSFLADPSDGRLADTTSMVESYVCRYLMPEKDLLRYGASLRGYDRYLAKKVFPHDHLPLPAGRVENRKREKVVHCLSNFIIYLTYRSNGVPKKVTSIFETYIHRHEKGTLLDTRSNLVVGDCSKSSYLTFGFHDQYTFGLISYLAVPFFLTITRNMKHFGDKLLFSTAFLVDHLYKYHAAAFSWRNLELIPEILDIHRSPELRDLIGNLIDYLSNYHIQRIVSGLHDFKFVRKVVEEIHFLSKISEEESAAFNFTLDESLSMKRHYNQRLAGLKADYARLETPPDEYVHSLGFIHMILGDLYFYDEEYDDAILEYQEAVQTLRQKPITPTSDKDLFLFLLMVRNMLKLGFALEKKKSFDSAFMIYGQLTSMIVGVRDIDLSKIGLKERFLKRWEVRPRRPLEKELNYELTTKEPPNDRRFPCICPCQGENVMGEIISPEIVGDETALCLSENFMTLLTHDLPFSPRKENLRFRLSVFEGIRLVYQPFLAKFQLIEKSNLGGVSTSDIRTIRNELDYLLKAINAHERFIIKAEFQNKVADVLYYKNGPKPGLVDARTQAPELRADRSDDRWWTLERCMRLYRFPRNIIENDRKLPCSACELYADSLKTLGKDYLHLEIHSGDAWSLVLVRIMDKLRIVRDDSQIAGGNQIYHLLQAHPTKDTVAARSLANTLSNLGDTFYSCVNTPFEALDKGKDSLWPFLDDLLDVAEGKPGVRCNPNTDPQVQKPAPEGKEERHSTIFEQIKANTVQLKRIEEVLLCYYLSAQVFLRAGERKETAFQYLKMLYVLKDLDFSELLRRAGTQDMGIEAAVGEFLEKIGRTIVRKALRCIVIAYDNIHFLEFERWADFVPDLRSDRTSATHGNPNYVSFGNDCWEIVLVYQELRLKLWSTIGAAKRCWEEFKHVQQSMTVSPYAEIDSMYNRIIELRLKAKFHFLWWRQKNLPTVPCPGDLQDKLSEMFSYLEGEGILPAVLALGFVISDALFCLTEIVRISMTFGISYMVNHSLVGLTHRKLVFWCRALRGYQNAVRGRLNETGLSAEDRRDLARRFENVMNDLEARIGAVDARTLTPEYHTEKAIRHLRQAMETHSEGKAYRTLIEQIYYLNDDFNDNLNHFCAASERFRINTGHEEMGLDRGKIKAAVVRMERDNEDARWLYDWRSYLGIPTDSKPTSPPG